MPFPVTSKEPTPTVGRKRLSVWANLLIHAARMTLVLDLWLIHPMLWRSIGDVPPFVTMASCFLALIAAGLLMVWRRQPGVWVGTLIIMVMRGMAYLPEVLTGAALLIQGGPRSPWNADAGLSWALACVPEVLFAIYVGAAVTLFRNRTAFGVERRRGWTTLVRRGWVFWLLAGVAQVAELVWYVMQSETINQPINRPIILCT